MSSNGLPSFTQRAGNPLRVRLRSAVADTESQPALALRRPTHHRINVKLIGRRGDEVRVAVEHCARIGERKSERPSVHDRVDFVEPKHERRDDAEVAAAAL